MWQAQHVADLLVQKHPGLRVELLPLVTRGDLILDQPLAAMGGKGLFLKELERALLDGVADLAVHSMKDVPVDVTVGLITDVVLERANPGDALLSLDGATIADLPAGAVVGSSSLRRQCQLLSTRADLQVADLRGNINTRIRKLEDGEYDAIILACAGLERLGLTRHVSEVLEAPHWLPATAQGTIGVQCRQADSEVRDIIECLQHPATRVITRVEREAAKRLQGSCQLPLAVYARFDSGQVKAQAMVGEADGGNIIRCEKIGPADHPEHLGKALAQDLLDQGAAAIIAGLASQNQRSGSNGGP